MRGTDSSIPSTGATCWSGRWGGLRSTCRKRQLVKRSAGQAVSEEAVSPESVSESAPGPSKYHPRRAGDALGESPCGCAVCLSFVILNRTRNFLVFRPFERLDCSDGEVSCGGSLL